MSSMAITYMSHIYWIVIIAACLLSAVTCAFLKRPIVVEEGHVVLAFSMLVASSAWNVVTREGGEVPRVPFYGGLAVMILVFYGLFHFLRSNPRTLLIVGARGRTIESVAARHLRSYGCVYGDDDLWLTPEGNCFFSLQAVNRLDTVVRITMRSKHKLPTSILNQLRVDLSAAARDYRLAFSFRGALLLFGLAYLSFSLTFWV